MSGHRDGAAAKRQRDQQEEEGSDFQRAQPVAVHQCSEQGAPAVINIESDSDSDSGCPSDALPTLDSVLGSIHNSLSILNGSVHVLSGALEGWADRLCEARRFSGRPMPDIMRWNAESCTLSVLVALRPTGGVLEDGELKHHITQLTALAALHLHECLSDAAFTAEVLSFMPLMTNLRALSLSGTKGVRQAPIVGSILSTLRAVSRITTLHHLDLSAYNAATHFSTVGDHLPNLLTSLVSLRKLDVSNLLTSYGAAQAMAQSMTCMSELQVLIMRDSYGGNDALLQIAQAIASMPTMRVLDISDCACVPCYFGQYLTALCNLHDLRTTGLDMASACELSDFAAQLTVLTALTALDVSGFASTDPLHHQGNRKEANEVTTALAASISVMTALQTLGVSNTSIVRVFRLRGMLDASWTNWAHDDKTNTLTRYGSSAAGGGRSQWSRRS